MDPSSSSPPKKRTFPSLYESSGNASEDRLAFFHVLERLKTQKRTGWVDRKIPDAESISDHMYRMAILAMCASDRSLDVTKCILMCLVHDLAEAQVGDIAPREGIPKEEKQRLEAEAMHNFVHVMLRSSPASLKIESLWKEYEEGQSAEALFVKGTVFRAASYFRSIYAERLEDLDRFEMASQALEYERRYEDQHLDVFFENSIPKLRHPEVQRWGADLMAERKKLQEQRVKESQVQTNQFNGDNPFDAL